MYMRKHPSRNIHIGTHKKRQKIKQAKKKCKDLSRLLCIRGGCCECESLAHFIHIDKWEFIYSFDSVRQLTLPLIPCPAHARKQAICQNSIKSNQNIALHQFSLFPPTEACVFFPFIFTSSRNSDDILPSLFFPSFQSYAIILIEFRFNLNHLNA